MQETTFSHDATYSAEDDKLRIYLAYHIGADEYSRVKEMGFKYAPKQGCCFAIWSPEREDFALELAGEITAEGTTLAERAAAKAERLDNLAAKNARKANSFHSAAHSISERFAYGQPILVGHHSERKARRDKARMESAMTQAVRCGEKVDYWNYKAEGVERHANYKGRDDVRARRIKTLLAELRGLQRTINESYTAIKLWERVESFKDDAEKFAKHVIFLAGRNYSPDFRSGDSVYSQLDSNKMTPEQALEISLEHHYKMVESEKRGRCIAHLLNRLAYERSELGDVERFEEELTPVILQAFLREHGTDSPKAAKSEKGFKAVSDAPLPVHICADLVEELDLSADEWRDLMQSCGYEVPAKKARKASTSAKAALPLINPTKEDAEKLQALWNARMASAVEKQKYGTHKIAALTEITQERYSANSKGDYSPFEAIELDAAGFEVRTVWRGMERVKSGIPVCRVRVSTAGYDSYKAKSVIIITDKTAKSLPIDWEV